MNNTNMIQRIRNNEKDIAENTKDIESLDVSYKAIASEMTDKFDEVNSSLETNTSDLNAKIDNKVTELKTNITDLNNTKALKTEVRLKSVKNTLEDCDDTMLQAIQGGSGASFNVLSIPQKESILDNMVNPLSYLGFKKRISINLFDKSRITPDCYVSYTSGNLSGYNATYCVTDYIELVVGEKYIFANTNEQWAFYDANKIYVSGGANINTYFNNIAIPSNVKYVRFTLIKANINNVTLYNFNEYYYGNWRRDLGYNYVNGIVAEEISKDLLARTNIRKVRNIYLKANGTGEFTDIQSANAVCTGGNINNEFNIFLEVGTYSVPKDFTPNDYVNIFAYDRERTKIHLEQSDTETKANIQQYSTLNLKYNNKFKNLTITCKNARYPIHDDGGVADVTHEFENCHIEHLGNQGARDSQNDQTIWTSECAYGSGTRSGNIFKFKNCTFKSNFAPFSIHNNVNFTKPSNVELENCNFILGENPIGSFKYSIRIQSDGSLVKDRIIFKGCKANYPMLLQDSWLGDTANKNRVEWLVEGYNNDIPFASEYSTGEMQVPNFNDEVRELQCTENIVKGNLCVYDKDLSKVRKMLPTDDISIFVGIAIEDKNSGELVKLKYKGYAYRKWITTLTSPFGTLFGCGSDSKLAVVTDKTKAILIGMGIDTLCYKFL